MANLNDLNKRIEEANMTLGDFENAKRKVAAENGGTLNYTIKGLLHFLMNNLSFF